MIPLLIVADASHLPAACSTLDVEVEYATALPAAASIERGRPTVIVLSPAWREADGGQLRELASRAALVVAGDPGETHAPDGVAGELAIAWLPRRASEQAAMASMRWALRHAAAVAAADASNDELRELTRIGVALSTERDITTLLKLILSQARRLVSADAGSLYLVERRVGEPAQSMRFALLQNHTLPDLPFREVTMAIDSRSIAGYVAVSGRPVVIHDVYNLDPGVPYRFNRSFDEQVGYRTQSVLAIPMRSHRDEIVGVLQLINRKRDADALLDSPGISAAQVIPFDDHCVTLSSALASQAAVAIENGELYRDIERLFEGFVTASVHTIEQRDPATSGHSSRVTAYTIGLADVLNRGGGRGEHATARFTPEEMRELKYACLLHDFGKVSVREAVLQKEKKLYGANLDAIRHRIVYLQQLLDIECERRRADYLVAHGATGYAEECASIEQQRTRRHAELDAMFETIVRANEPSILAERTSDELQVLAAMTFVDHAGNEQHLLSEDELRFLSIRRGNLDDRERREIESHATQSYTFLTRIPWTIPLREIPDIVWGHHEKLNGRGYPRGIKADQLRIQSRMMTIADIFDALTAADRPYKKAVTVPRAIEILRQEANDGALDKDLLETFIEARVWETVAEEVREKTREARRTAATPGL